jgi:cytoskeletal protein RodZ
MDQQRTAPPRRPSGYTAEQLNARALARARRDAMLRRARRIRRSVVGLAAALFSAAFLVVYVQLASGHDPALSSKNSTQASTSATAAGSKSSSTSAGTESSTSSSSPSSSGESSTSSSSSGEESSATSSEEESSNGASAVTTSQS